MSAVLFRLIYSVARLLLTRGKCEKGEREAAARRLLMHGKCGKGERGKVAEVKANKGKASSDSFTIGSCEEDPG